MKATPRVMLLEFNELSPHVMDRFIAEGHLPSFKRLRDQSQLYTTEAAERGWDLNPWVQWVTVHSGLDYRDHGISELDEGGKLAAKRVWDVVCEAGLPVWVCGSMNVAYQAPVRGLVMPDPWTTKVAPSDALTPFFRFVQRNVTEHSNASRPLSRRDYLEFVRFMVGHGLSLQTAMAIVRQLVAERTSPDQHWKRAVLLDKLQFDVFSWYYRKTRPVFSTFFSNSTAHFQHYYWRDMEPELFKVQSTPAQRAAHNKAILFGYREMDKLIARAVALAGPETIVVFATAISQQPCLVYEDQGGKVMYRPRDFAKLMDFAGVTESHTVAPVMAEVFNIHLTNELDAARVERRLTELHTGGKPTMQLLRKGAVINAKCQLHEKLGEDARIELRSAPRTAPFFDVFYQLEDMKSGMHHPDGMLWIRIPQKAPQLHDSKVPLASVAPTLLRLLSLPQPSHMKTPGLAV